MSGPFLAVGYLGTARFSTTTTRLPWDSMSSGDVKRKIQRIRKLTPIFHYQLCFQSQAIGARTLIWSSLFFHSTGSIVMPHDQSWYCGNSNPNRTTCAYQGLWEKTFPVPHITVGLTNVEPPKPW